MNFFLFVLLTVLVMAGCSGKDEPSVPKEEVSLKFDYSFIESGNMSRSANDLYTSFYDQYVKTKILTPKTFTLSFKNKETGAVATFNGIWSQKDLIKLLEGTYEVVGTSEPLYADRAKRLDSLSLSFKEDIIIDKNTTSVVLSALHASYMLMFDKENISEIKYKNTFNSPVEQGSIALHETSNIYFMVLKSMYWTNSENLIAIKKKDGLETIVRINDIPFEKGKYYYFNDVSNSFDIPPMEAGK